MILHPTCYQTSAESLSYWIDFFFLFSVWSDLKVPAAVFYCIFASFSACVCRRLCPEQGEKDVLTYQILLDAYWRTRGIWAFAEAQSSCLFLSTHQLLPSLTLMFFIFLSRDSCCLLSVTTLNMTFPLSCACSLSWISFPTLAHGKCVIGRP